MLTDTTVTRVVQQATTMNRLWRAGGYACDVERPLYDVVRSLSDEDAASLLVLMYMGRAEVLEYDEPFADAQDVRSFASGYQRETAAATAEILCGKRRTDEFLQQGVAIMRRLHLDWVHLAPRAC